MLPHKRVNNGEVTVHTSIRHYKVTCVHEREKRGQRGSSDTLDILLVRVVRASGDAVRQYVHTQEASTIGQA